MAFTRRSGCGLWKGPRNTQQYPQMISKPTREMIRARLPGLVCVSVLCGIFVAGLWPFHAPRNAVTWLENQNGVCFSRYGTIMSSGAFQMAGWGDKASSSFEIWLQPARSSASHTILSFSTPENPLQLSLNQYLSNLVVQREIQNTPHRIGIEGVFRQVKTPVYHNNVVAATDGDVF